MSHETETNSRAWHVGGLALSACGTLAGLSAIPLLRWPEADIAGSTRYGLASIGHWSPSQIPAMPFVLLLVASLAACVGYGVMAVVNRDGAHGPLPTTSWALMGMGMTACWAGTWGMAAFLRDGTAYDHWAPYLLGNSLAGLGLASAGVGAALLGAMPWIRAARSRAPSWSPR